MTVFVTSSRPALTGPCFSCTGDPRTGYSAPGGGCQVIVTETSEQDASALQSVSALVLIPLRDQMVPNFSEQRLCC